MQRIYLKCRLAFQPNPSEKKKLPSCLFNFKFYQDSDRSGRSRQEKTPVQSLSMILSYKPDIFTPKFLSLRAFPRSLVFYESKKLDASGPKKNCQAPLIISKGHARFHWRPFMIWSRLTAKSLLCSTNNSKKKLVKMTMGQRYRWVKMSASKGTTNFGSMFRIPIFYFTGL